jgi:hypothetical protein
LEEIERKLSHFNALLSTIQAGNINTIFKELLDYQKLPVFSVSFACITTIFSIHMFLEKSSDKKDRY